MPAGLSVKVVCGIHTLSPLSHSAAEYYIIIFYFIQASLTLTRTMTDIRLEPTKWDSLIEALKLGCQYEINWEAAFLRQRQWGSLIDAEIERQPRYGNHSEANTLRYDTVRQPQLRWQLWDNLSQANTMRQPQLYCSLNRVVNGGGDRSSHSGQPWSMRNPDWGSLSKICLFWQPELGSLKYNTFFKFLASLL